MLAYTYIFVCRLYINLYKYIYVYIYIYEMLRWGLGEAKRMGVHSRVVRLGSSRVGSKYVDVSRAKSSIRIDRRFKVLRRRESCLYGPALHPKYKYRFLYIYIYLCFSVCVCVHVPFRYGKGGRGPNSAFSSQGHVFSVFGAPRFRIASVRPNRVIVSSLQREEGGL